MRQTVLLALLLAYVLSFLAACSRNNDSSPSANRASGEAPPAAKPSDGVRRVSVAELKSALEKNEAVVIDVRGEVEYKLGHIRGSRSIPLGLVASRADELPRDKLIVSYCA